jgi:hypothetical protein
MGVLTSDEFYGKQDAGVSIKAPAVPDIVIPEQSRKAEPKSNLVWSYAHPDNGKDCPIEISKTCVTLSGGETIDVKVDGGVVRTDREDVHLALLAQGWVFIKCKEKIK